MDIRKRKFEDLNSTPIWSLVHALADGTDIEDLLNEYEFYLIVKNNGDNTFDDGADPGVNCFASSSTSECQILSTIDVTDKSVDTSENDDGPIDLSIKKAESQNSAHQTQANPEPINAFSKRINAYHDVKHQEREIPLAHSASNARTEPMTLMVDRECSSTTDSVSIPIVEKKLSCTEQGRGTLQKIYRSPIKILEELLGLQGFQPKYELQRLFNVNNLMFECNARFKNHFGYGAGESIKDSMDKAASSLLEKLMNSMDFGDVISYLQEFCQAQNWPDPKYAEEMNIQSPDFYGSIFSCSVKQHREFGQGKNREMAKFFAAYKMWLKLTTPK